MHKLSFDCPGKEACAPAHFPHRSQIIFSPINRLFPNPSINPDRWRGRLFLR